MRYNLFGTHCIYPRYMFRKIYAVRGTLIYYESTNFELNQVRCVNTIVVLSLSLVHTYRITSQKKKKKSINLPFKSWKDLERNKILCKKSRLLKMLFSWFFQAIDQKYLVPDFIRGKVHVTPLFLVRRWQDWENDGRNAPFYTFQQSWKVFMHSVCMSVCALTLVNILQMSWNWYKLFISDLAWIILKIVYIRLTACL